MTTLLTLRTERHDDQTITVVATGEIDLSNADAFADAINTAVADSSGQSITIDLGAVDYLDSGAINALFTCAEHTRLVIANPLIMAALTITGLTEATTVHARRLEPEG